MRIFKNNFITYFMLLLALLLLQTSSISAIGINGVDITSDGQISIGSDASVDLPENGDGVNQISKHADTFLEKNKWFVNFFVGGCFIIIGGIWIYKIYQFSKSGSDSSERKKAMNSLVVLGVATAMLGGLTMFVTFATGLFNI